MANQTSSSKADDSLHELAQAAKYVSGGAKAEELNLIKVMTAWTHIDVAKDAMRKARGLMQMLPEGERSSHVVDAQVHKFKAALKRIRDLPKTGKVSSQGEATGGQHHGSKGSGEPLSGWRGMAGSRSNVSSRERYKVLESVFQSMLGTAGHTYPSLLRPLYNALVNLMVGCEMLPSGTTLEEYEAGIAAYLALKKADQKPGGVNSEQDAISLMETREDVPADGKQPAPTLQGPAVETGKGEQTNLFKVSEVDENAMLPVLAAPFHREMSAVQTKHPGKSQTEKVREAIDKVWSRDDTGVGELSEDTVTAARIFMSQVAFMPK